MSVSNIVDQHLQLGPLADNGGPTLQRATTGVRWITQQEAAALVNAARQEPKAPHLADFIILGLHTGMRTHEMLYERIADGREVGLEWRRVDLQQNLVYLDDTHQKNGKSGSVPLNQIARAAILSRLRFQADIRTTMRYAHLAPEDSRQAVAVLESIKSHLSHSDFIEELSE